jgi:hypothetical protein
MLNSAAPETERRKDPMPERSGARSRVVHQNLDTAYVSLAALVRYLQQRDFEGRVHVELDEYDADIYLAARERPRARERDHVTGREAEGEAALQRIFVRASEPGGRVSVFEGDAVEAGELGEHRPAAAVFADSASRGAVARTQDETDRRVVLQLSGELIGAVERAVAASAGGEFAARFREARGELTGEYPFLASLASCVEYEGGEARLARGADAGAFVAGVCEALRRVVERAAAEDGGARGVRREVARELAALAERRPRALARLNFTPQLERIAGIRWT